MLPDWRTMTKEEAFQLPEPDNGAGVYFLWYQGALVYVGASRGMSDRILRHWRTRRYGEMNVVNRKYITWDKETALKCRIEEASDIEAELIKRFEPGLNLLENGGNRWTFDRARDAETQEVKHGSNE